MKNFDRRIFSSWTFGNPVSLRFFPEPDGDDPPADPPAPPVTDLPSWLNDPEYSEILADETNKNILSFYKSRPELAKALIEKEKTIRSGFKIPKNLNDQQKTELRAHMDKINGVPEKPEGYRMSRPEQIEEGLDLSEQTKMEIRATAKEKGVGDDALQAIYEKALYAMARAKTEAAKAQEEQFEKDRVATVALMQKYFGPQEYQKLTGDENNDGVIERFVKSRAVDTNEYGDLLDKLEKTGLRNHPLLFKVMGDAARFYEILEGSAPGNRPEFAATRGSRAQSEKNKYAKLFPNTPASHGGGAPG